MKICITSQGDTLEAKVDPRFGRCQYFLYIDTQTDQCEAVENPFKEGGGAGIQVGQVMADSKVAVVLTGNVGPNAFQTLQAANIQVVPGVSGFVKDVYAQFKRGETGPSANGPSVESHSGLQS